MGERLIGEDDLQAYVDGYLTPERRSAVETYFATNATAAAQVSAYISQRQALREALRAKAAEPVPSHLRISSLIASQHGSSKRLWKTAAAAAIWLGLGITVGASGHAWVASREEAATPGTGRVAQDAITAYRTYVVEKAHPVEVGANQEAHLVQWLSRRVGKPLQAPNLTAQGFRLIGGRLLPADNSPAALFMYENDQGNRLTFYARLEHQETPTAFRFESEGDIAAFTWIDQDLSYVITGRTDRERLLAIAEAIYRQVEESAPPLKGSL